MPDADDAIDALRIAAEANRADPLRTGGLLRFPSWGQLVVTGDLHGHTRNFEKLMRFCDLSRAAVRHVLLHEIIHAEPTTPDGHDLSAEMLVHAARWKCDFPDQVHFIQSNHELAQLTGKEITKAGRSVTSAFIEGVEHLYGRNHRDAILDAIADFIRSYPAAARTANRIFIAHSLPDAYDMRDFRPDFIYHDVDPLNPQAQPHLHRLVWGRYHTPQQLDALARQWDVDLFVLGHQPQETGWFVLHDRALILASDHNHGVFLPIDLSRPATIDDLLQRLRPFVAVP